MPLGPGEEFRFIPLHNGYMYLLIKTVIVGLLWFALFILQQVLSGFRSLQTRILEMRMAGPSSYGVAWCFCLHSLSECILECEVVSSEAH